MTIANRDAVEIEDWIIEESAQLQKKILKLCRHHDYPVYMNSLTNALFSGIMGATEDEMKRRMLVDQVFQHLCNSINEEYHVDTDKRYAELMEEVKNNQLHQHNNLQHLDPLKRVTDEGTVVYKV